MAKIKKSMLKNVVKECLVEILSEGIGGMPPASRQPATRHSDPYDEIVAPSQPVKRGKATGKSRKGPKPYFQNSSLDQKVFSESHNPAPPQSVRPAPDQERVEQVVNQITDDPIMSQILADTANTTLQEQASHESPARASQPGAEIPVSDISEVELFAGSSKKWAELAFSDKPK